MDAGEAKRAIPGNTAKRLREEYDYSDENK